MELANIKKCNTYGGNLFVLEQHCECESASPLSTRAALCRSTKQSAATATLRQYAGKFEIFNNAAKMPTKTIESKSIFSHYPVFLLRF